MDLWKAMSSDDANPSLVPEGPTKLYNWKAQSQQ